MFCKILEISSNDRLVFSSTAEPLQSNKTILLPFTIPKPSGDTTAGVTALQIYYEHLHISQPQEKKPSHHNVPCFRKL
jgi:hypothetical protein